MSSMSLVHGKALSLQPASGCAAVNITMSEHGAESLVQSIKPHELNRVLTHSLLVQVGPEA